MYRPGNTFIDDLNEAEGRFFYLTSTNKKKKKEGLLRSALN